MDRQVEGLLTCPKGYGSGLQAEALFPGRLRAANGAPGPAPPPPGPAPGRWPGAFQEGRGRLAGFSAGSFLALPPTHPSPR